MGEIEDVIYFRRKLYESLGVPVSRMESDSQFNLGRASEITRDELKFAKFISRMRFRFSELFHIILEKQLLLKGIITKQEWSDIKNKIYYDFLQDNHFTELKQAEILRERISLVRDIDEFVGKYYSAEWVRKNVLYQTEEEIEEIDAQIDLEVEENPPEDDEDNVQ